MNWWKKLWHFCDNNYTTVESYRTKTNNFVELRKCKKCEYKWAVHVGERRTIEINLEWYYNTAKVFKNENE